MTERLDEGLDREIRAYLAWRTGRLGGAPTALEMASWVARRKATSLRSIWPPSRLGWLVAAVLLALTVLGVVVMAGMRPPLFSDATVEPTQPRTGGLGPENGWIAYSTRAHDAQNGVPGEIFLTIAGQPVQRLAGGGNETICPSFSPDGTKLSYVEADDVVVVEGDPAQGMAEIDRAIDVGRMAGTCPVWSPTSEALALLVRDGVAIHRPGLDRTIPASPPWDAESTLFPNHNPLAWAPDGSAIAYAAGDGIWLLDPDGSDSRRISDARAESIGWSSDSSRLVYETATLELDRMVSKVSVFGIDEPGEVLVLGVGDRPVWAPSGDLIAFSSPDGLVTVRADGSGPRVVHGAAGYGFGGWSPKGDYLLYMFDRTGAAFDMWAVSTIDGSILRITPLIQTGGSRNFPDMGDVTWQAIYP